ncbi:MAG: hypothetical protein QM742_12645 [Aquabacterium sp.]
MSSQSFYLFELGSFADGPIKALRRVAMAMVAAFGAVWLSGCDQLGIETPQKAAAHQEAESKAIGSACRHAMRAIEDCYSLNPKADKSAVFAGWREMDEYMRENKLEGVAPVVPRPAAQAASAASAASSKSDESSEDEEVIEDEPSKAKASSKGAKAKGH